MRTENHLEKYCKTKHQVEIELIVASCWFSILIIECGYRRLHTLIKSNSQLANQNKYSLP